MGLKEPVNPSGELLHRQCGRKKLKRGGLPGEIVLIHKRLIRPEVIQPEVNNAQTINLWAEGRVVSCLPVLGDSTQTSLR